MLEGLLDVDDVTEEEGVVVEDIETEDVVDTDAE